MFPGKVCTGASPHQNSVVLPFGGHFPLVLGSDAPAAQAKAVVSDSAKAKVSANDSSSADSGVFKDSANVDLFDASQPIPPVFQGAPLPHELKNFNQQWVYSS